MHHTAAAACSIIIASVGWRWPLLIILQLCAPLLVPLPLSARLLLTPSSLKLSVRTRRRARRAPVMIGLSLLGQLELKATRKKFTYALGSVYNPPPSPHPIFGQEWEEGKPSSASTSRLFLLIFPFLPPRNLIWERNKGESVHISHIDRYKTFASLPSLSSTLTSSRP